MEEALTFRKNDATFFLDDQFIITHWAAGGCILRAAQYLEMRLLLHKSKIRLDPLRVPFTDRVNHGLRCRMLKKFEITG